MRIAKQSKTLRKSKKHLVFVANCGFKIIRNQKEFTKRAGNKHICKMLKEDIQDYFYLTSRINKVIESSFQTIVYILHLTLQIRKGTHLNCRKIEKN